MAAEYILALDYGSKRVGVAIAHTIARLPRPVTTLPNNETLLADIAKMVAAENVGQVLVGLPRGMDGGYTEQTREAESFATQLAHAITVPVELADETLTSVDAESALGGTRYDKAEVDALAATYILERYLTEHPASLEENR